MNERLYIPVENSTTEILALGVAQVGGLDAIGRLKPGVPLFSRPREDMDRVSRTWLRLIPPIDSDKKANILSLKDEMVGRCAPFS